MSWIRISRKPDSLKKVQFPLRLTETKFDNSFDIERCDDQAASARCYHQISIERQ